jgi:DNA-binding response OmpR family regulator
MAMINTKGSRNERILVVEDHPESAELLQMILETEGYEARCGFSPRDQRIKQRNGAPT